MGRRTKSRSTSLNWKSPSWRPLTVLPYDLATVSTVAVSPAVSRDAGCEPTTHGAAALRLASIWSSRLIPTACACIIRPSFVAEHPRSYDLASGL